MVVVSKLWTAANSSKAPITQIKQMIRNQSMALIYGTWGIYDCAPLIKVTKVSAVVIPETKLYLKLLVIKMA